MQIVKAVVSTLQRFNLSWFFVFSVFNSWQMNPYDRSTAFGKKKQKLSLYIVCNLEDNLISFDFSCTKYSTLVLCPLTLLSLFVSIYTAIGPDGLCCQSREFKEWHGCRSTKGVSKGVYFQVVWDLKQDYDFETTDVHFTANHLW